MIDIIELLCRFFNFQSTHLYISTPSMMMLVLKGRSQYP